MEGKTSSYMIREEMKREKLRGRTGKRAWTFEIERRRGWFFGIRLKEIRDNIRKLEGWEKERGQ